MCCLLSLGCEQARLCAQDRQEHGQLSAPFAELGEGFPGFPRSLRRPHCNSGKMHKAARVSSAKLLAQCPVSGRDRPTLLGIPLEIQCRRHKLRLCNHVNDCRLPGRPPCAQPVCHWTCWHVEQQRQHTHKDWCRSRVLHGLTFSLACGLTLQSSCPGARLAASLSLGRGQARLCLGSPPFSRSFKTAVVT